MLNIQMGSGTKCSRKRVNIPCFIHDTYLCQINLILTYNKHGTEN